MSSKMSFDELNIIQYTDEEVEAFLDEYFKPMFLPYSELEKRKDAAREFREVLLFILLAAMVADNMGDVDWETLRVQMQNQFRPVVEKYSRDDEFTRDFIEKATDDFIDVSRRHLGEDKWFSDERALPDAANYANMTVGYEDLQEAIESGKKKKMWVSQRDGRVRHTHRVADGQTVPINGYFTVGNSLLAYPTDPEGEPEEIISCRCHVVYK